MSARGRRVLIAGIGNVFLSDDGFGVEVVKRITTDSPGRPTLPNTAEVADFGIRGVHLAFELLNGRHDTLIMVDAVPLDGPPGTLAVLHIDDKDGDATAVDPAVDAAVDGHGMHPQAVLRLLRILGGTVESASEGTSGGTSGGTSAGTVGRVLVVGCAPAVLDEGMGLSAPVAAAVDRAVQLVTQLAWTEAYGDQSRDAVQAHARWADA